MSPKRLKVLIGVKKSFDKHIGHFITLNSGKTAKLESSAVINENLMLKFEGDHFAAHYSDEAKKCSCGEGQ